ncbi:transglycosylase SLT domain-containing protein [Salmonella enterica]|nr:transglycosylase SLT domain-containing protein [Salmonella enterica]EKT1325638.1 transglycosylase SLT domain-containing protein [Salmonella enterica]EKT1358773.1 transglycosylase SLT domain-containing protein [Salmonella enterica]EKT2634807.1 transglycosylase SLT domain-containing protein [Salmonella enterica]EKT3223744.1 transglycosylase SLT domain-containing protein [Salmonella enterica]
MARRGSLMLALLLILPGAHAAQDIPVGYRQVAQQADIPAELLYAVALTESGSRMSQGIRPWPWTLNVAGKGYRYASRQEACTALNQFMRTTSPKRIDAGLSQINIGWNGHHFDTPCDALAPYPNLQVAARLLRGHYDKWLNWSEAAGRYHHPAGGKPAQRYRQQVIRHLQNLSS